MSLNKPSSAAEGRYLYCVADAGAFISLGTIGIDGKEVYAVSYRDISAIVHDCHAEPYHSEDQAQLRHWATAHQATVDSAWNRCGVVLPFTFNTIVRVEAGGDAGQNISRWIEDNHDGLKQKIERVRGKAEYGVQVFWEPRLVAEDIARTIPEIEQLEEQIRSKPRGMAYMCRQRIEGLLKKEMEAAANRFFNHWYSRIREFADEVHIEKVKKGEGDVRMVLNLSCLVGKDRYVGLGEELDKIGQIRGLSVRFTGPWPPYSFVG